MRIEEELKLDYSDVLFRPKRSTLRSRKDVNLLRTYRFKYSKNEWSGIPIMAANMDGVGELSIAEKLSEHGMKMERNQVFHGIFYLHLEPGRNPFACEEPVSVAGATGTLNPNPWQRS